MAPKKTPIPNDKVHFNPFPPGSVKAKVASDMEIGEGMEHSPFSEHFGTPDKPHGKGFVPSTKGLTSTLAEINITTRKAKETVEEMNPEDSVKKSKKYLEKQGLA